MSQPLTHRRQVVLVRGQGIVVCDWVEGVVPTGFATHWPLAARSRDAAISETTLAAFDHSITWGTTSGEIQASLEPMRRSPRYGRSCEATLLRLDYSGLLPTALVTCFGALARPLTVQRSTRDAVRVRLAADRAEDASTLVVRPGGPPIVERSRTHATSQRVNS